jgi:hypothetical protein
MLIKGLRILWFKLQVEKHKHLCLPLPIPLYIFQELLDCILDLLTLAFLFVPSITNPNSSNTVNTIQELVQMIMKLFDSLTEGAPYDLVDVTADKIKVSIKIR